jgi:hypothetical protein
VTRSGRWAEVPPGLLRWPSAASREWAERAIPQLCSSENVLAVVLLGSSVRPGVPSFDLDCLYVFRNSNPELPRPPMEVDVRGYRAEEADALIARSHELLVWSLRLGSLVCERESYWSTLQQRWRDRLPFPSPEAAEARAAAAHRLFVELREMGDDDAAIEQLVSAATHRGRAALLRAGVFPASRPELPDQLRAIGERVLASALADALEQRAALTDAPPATAPHRQGDAA